ncbi:MAG: hypothetical protein WC865_18090 [Bacteroidales bacterium]
MKKVFMILFSLIPLTLSAQVTTNTGNVTGVNKATTGSTSVNLNTPGVAGQTTTVSATSAGQKELSEVLTGFKGHEYNYFEINQEMFKAFCELEYADSTTIALFSKIKSVKMLELVRTPKEQKLLDAGKLDNEPWDPQFYVSVTSQLDLTGYTQLLRSKNYRTLALFLKKEYGPVDNEFLLITDRLVIDIRGDIMIKTIYQMEEMMGYVQQILPN